jgi:hypothetical protein
MNYSEADEILNQASLTSEDVVDLKTFLKELADLIVEAMDNPPRLTPENGRDWEERAMEAVS